MKKRILVVDDDFDVRESLKCILRSADYEVEEAAGRQSAESRLKESRFDLIILDVMMEKDTDGFVFAQQLRKDPELCRIPIVMVTSVNQRTPFRFDAGTDGEFLPVDRFIEKPVDSERILTAVGQLLN